MRIALRALIDPLPPQPSRPLPPGIRGTRRIVAGTTPMGCINTIDNFYDT
ncbi:hypothetical protein J2X65_005241 [Ancylobacter sp. 3268]|nr:hypothetical protein [Ancylobacter sp. 3268]